jgi:GNAT superfamily N-acetyltransferase
MTGGARLYRYDKLAPVSLDVRPEPFDGPAARALIAAVQQEYVHRYGGPDETPLDPTEFNPPDGAFFIGYLDGEPVACGGWRRHGGDAEIKRMYVVPERRRQGLSRTMLAALERTAADAGVSRMILETGTAQPEAIALYESAGYTLIPGFGIYAGEPECRSFSKAVFSEVHTL